MTLLEEIYLTFSVKVLPGWYTTTRIHVSVVFFVSLWFLMEAPAIPSVTEEACPLECARRIFFPLSCIYSLSLSLVILFRRNDNGERTKIQRPKTRQCGKDRTSPIGIRRKELEFLSWVEIYVFPVFLCCTSNQK